ncbi:hypothetical protein BO70DRAFT_359778 [Aspergillus heteromorphus CBS 117.55]|uniref:Phosphatidylglycerol lysyltransferase C-terminal domain-containing protein n=1 Tax=Aspergillus heteromorphus CBS 117.55 TaxID=1448321 RepID=A0A317WVN7_9EURO|nr:uncharacterized protein BO70DRAFT_359778 [Aspergillus heteromorphus CBS 117.55]PWY88340.1 hypothetical protein BO70DRAFT_359778 [Aspergillus heteromorphus CBS 117.55]
MVTHDRPLSTMSPSSADQPSQQQQKQKQKPRKPKNKSKNKPDPQPAAPKVLLADKIGQSLYDRLIDSSSANTTHSTSSSLKSLASSRTSHDSSSSSSSSSNPNRNHTHNKPLPLSHPPNPHPHVPPPPVSTITSLAAHHGQISHMGLLDPSYHLFLNTTHTGLLCFKVLNKVAIIAGDPLCHPSSFSSLLSEFKVYRKRQHWGIAFLGASPELLHHARITNAHWTSLQFGQERVLNPLTSPILAETAGKRILVQNKQLLKGGWEVDVYVPGGHGDEALESELRGIYDEWRSERNTSGTTQAFITEYDPFSMPELMTYVYCKGPGTGPDSAVCGFAALRWIGAKGGYHLDPCIARPGAARGLSDLLVFSAMALLRKAGVGYLGFGYEPFEHLGEVVGLPGPVEKMTRMVYRYTFQRLPISGKKAYHDRFRPDEDLDRGLFLVFPAALPEVRQMVAMTHIANISIRRLVFRV